MPRVRRNAESGPIVRPRHRTAARSSRIAPATRDASRLRPAAVAREPQGRGKMMKGDDGRDADGAACGDHAPVMVESRAGKKAFFRFDARPFDRKSIGAESQSFEQSQIVGIEMIVIAGVARGLDEEA